MDDKQENPQKTRSVGDLLRSLQETAEAGEDISLETLQGMAGARLHGPMLLVPGLVAVSPLSGIPTVPTVLGLIISLVCLQLIWGKEHLWLPKWLKTASIDAAKVARLGGFLGKASRVLDAISKRRLEWLVEGFMLRLAGFVCLLAAVSMPLLEIVPFSATTAGTIISVFGLSMTTRDGLLMLLAFAVFAGLFGLGIYLFMA